MKTPSHGLVFGAWIVTVFAVMSLRPDGAQASWQSLGSRWAIERGKKGAVLSVHDLSYPGAPAKESIGKLPPIQTAKSELLSANVDWWKAVPWKNFSALQASTQGAAVGAPQSFSLDDIDFSKTTADYKLFNQFIAAAGFGFLKNVRFELESDGSYRIFASADPRAWAAQAAGEQTVLSTQAGPGIAASVSDATGLRVVTLSGRLRRNLWRSLGYQIAENLAKAAPALSFNPVVSAILGTALDRYFHWRDLLTWNRREALAELLSDPPADFELTSYERSRAAQALLYAETTIAQAPAWLWRRPARRWAKRVASEGNAAANSRSWLKSAGVSTQQLGDTHDWDPKTRVFYMSGLGLTFGHKRRGPWPAIDPLHPNAIVVRRVAIEVAVCAALFGSTWAPYIGAVGAWVFKNILEFPEDRRRSWETRLAARLEERSRRGENWESELALLARQQINPFEVTRARSVTLVSSRRAALKLAPTGALQAPIAIR